MHPLRLSNDEKSQPIKVSHMPELQSFFLLLQYLGTSRTAWKVERDTTSRRCYAGFLFVSCALGAFQSTLWNSKFVLFRTHRLSSLINSIDMRSATSSVSLSAPRLLSTFPRPMNNFMNNFSCCEVFTALFV